MTEMETKTNEPSANLTALGAAFMEIRVNAGVSIEKLVETTGVEEEVIRSLEDGRFDADYELLIRLGEGIGGVYVTTILRRAVEIKEDQEAELAALGAAVSEILERSGATVAELAQTTGISASVIEKVCAGTMDPDYVSLIRLGRGLGVSGTVIVGRAGEIRMNQDTATQ